MLNKFREQHPKFKYLFQFDEFNDVQQECYPKIFNSTDNMIVSAPTSSGKTVLFELLIVKLMSERKTKCLYLAPIKSLCHEKFNSWRKKFMSTMQIMELTGDTLDMGPEEFGNADIYVATPEKIDYISRKNLNFLKELNLLLIDEIHMLNMEDRGAILEAIVSRIMSINKKIRIMAVSATIPNIKEVAQWLKVPPHLICVFGEEYRPAKLNKIVLGFKPANNDFNFEKMLNFKLLDVIRNYSFGRGTLIFCQTQKGTEEACNKLVQQAHAREFVQNEHLSMELINSSKVVDNNELKSLLPHGVAFHNASLSMKDRSIVETLFLDFKIKVLCTTSTLAMGINLPARLVIIKSTKSYKGSGKGYQEYTQIELDQMMGRAGRMPFDKEGTVVIMTEKNNYNKYVGNIKLENLESQLYYQFIDHLNTEISLKSIQSLEEAIEYLKNSFCYIRMQNSPKLYNLQNFKETEKFVNETCLKSVQKLAQYEIVQFIESNKKIFPKQCSNNISKNAIEVETIIRAIDSINQIKTEREFLTLLCQANEFSKYRSKLDERKYLKDLNEKNRYTIKESISTAEKKCFVLIQAEMSGIHIENWELRKQASEMVYFFKRLAYCVKSLALERKNSSKTFWLYLYGCLFHKYFSQGFWETNDEKVLKQIKKVMSKWKNVSARGIRSLNDLTYGLNKLDIFGNGMSSAMIKKSIEDEIHLLNGSLQISSKKIENQQKSEEIIDESPHQNYNYNNKETNHLIKFIFTQNFDEKFKSITVIIEHNAAIYITGNLNSNVLEFSAFLKNTISQKYFIAVIKEGYVGFDEFYWFEYGMLKKTELKKEENEKKLAKVGSIELTTSHKRKSNKMANTEEEGDSEHREESNNKKRESNSLSSSLKRLPKNNKVSGGKLEKSMPRQINYISKNSFSNAKNIESIDKFENEEKKFKSSVKPLKKDNKNDDEPLSSTMKINKKSKQLKLTENFNTIKRRFVHDEEFEQKQLEKNPYGKQMKKSEGFRDLKSYNWKPGFEEIKDYQISNSFENYETEELEEKGELTKSNEKKKLLIFSEEESEHEEETQKNSFKNNKISKKGKRFINELSDFEFNNVENHQKKNFALKNQTLSENDTMSSTVQNGKIEYPRRINYDNETVKSKRLLQENKIFKPFDHQESEKNFWGNKLLKKESKKKFPSKIFFEDLEKPISVQEQKIKEKTEEKKFKNAYEYFESFLEDEED